MSTNSGEIHVKCDAERAKVNEVNSISLILSGENANSYSLAIPSVVLTVKDRLIINPTFTAETS